MTERNSAAKSHVLVFDNLLGCRAHEQSASILFDDEHSVELRLEITITSSFASVIRQMDHQTIFKADLASDCVCRIFPKKFIITKTKENEAYCLICDTEIEASRLNAALQGVQSGKSEECWFDKKTEKSSSDLYFHYYGTLQHQQNMLQDCIRTGTYYMAFVNNTVDFQGKTVMDVGAGTSMLSLFAAQAGARKVYAVEASPMARYGRRLVQKNTVTGSIPSVEVIESKIEELRLDEKVDVLISEPIGTLLVNERMLETYIFARDHFLKPGGKMFPTLGRIHVAAFSDDVLYQEILSRATFWLQNNFYGVDLSSLHHDALNQYFTQVVVDAFDPSLLVSNVAVHPVNFTTIAEKDLYDIKIPLSYTITRPCVVHGVGCWFDLFFNGTSKEVCLTTAPGTPTTHWFQLRCVLPQPLCVVGGSRIIGDLRLQAHAKQSYTITLVLEVPPPAPGIPSQRVEYSYDLKEPYYRQLMNCWQAPAATTLPVGEAAYYHDNHTC